MKKTILAAASYDKQKYFMEHLFSSIPEGIKEEIRVMCIITAEKLFCTFVIGFLEDGNIYFETVKPEGVIDFDDIGAELEIKKIRNEKEELIKALKLWFLIYNTKEGEGIKNEIMKGVK